MFDAHAVAEGHLMVVAGAAAIGLVRSRGEEGAEDAVFHVEHGHMVVDNDLEPGWIDGREQVIELLEAEVVRCRDPLGPPGLEPCDGQVVGGVERVVGHESEVVGLAKPEAAGVADQQTVGTGFRQKAEETGLARFFDPRRGQKDLKVRLAVPKPLNSLPIELDVMEIEIDGSEARRDGGFGLVQVAAESDQLGWGDAVGGVWGGVSAGTGWGGGVWFVWGAVAVLGSEAREDGIGGEGAWGRGVDLGQQLGDQIAAELIQQAVRNERLAFDSGLEATEVKGSSSEALALGSESFGGGRVGAGRGKRLGGVDRCAEASFCRGLEAERLAGGRRDD